MPSTVDYRGSKLITPDYYWMFSMYGYLLLQTLVCKADWQYHGSTTLTVEYILLILLLQYSFLIKSEIPPRYILSYNTCQFSSSGNPGFVQQSSASCYQSPEFHLFGFAKFKFSLSSGILIATSHSSLPWVYVLLSQ